MPNKQKIAIIGGGICGLYLAWKLSEKGNQVCVFEKKAQIGNDACSGLFSRRILDYIPQSEALIKNRINSAFLNFPRKTLKINFSKEFFVMSHFELDNLVSNLAKESGAEIRLNSAIHLLPEGFDRTIGCDGYNSFVRQCLGLPTPNFRLGILGFVSAASAVDFVETWPTSKGFLWKIPRGDKVEYGVLEEPLRARNIFEDFQEKNNIKLENIRAKLIPQGLRIPINERITLCGDAAGLTKPWSGGGVIWGLTAAEILLKTFPDFIKYQKLAKRFFSHKIFISKAASGLVYPLGVNFPYFFPKSIKIESDFLM